MTTNSSLDNMINALGLEIEAIKKSGGSSVLEIMGGELKGESGGNYLYAFQVLENIYLRDDSPIKCVIGKEEVTGYVVSFGNGILIIALEKNVGLKIPFGRLISDDSFLIERLKEKLEEVLTDTSYFSHEKALQTIGDSTFKTEENEVDQKTIKGSPHLNSEQIGAVSKSLGSEITFIWGPPGTGKTTVLARIVEAFYRQDLSVLIVSNTNIAVDTALEKISDRLNTESGFQQGEVIRFGPVIKEELLNKYGDRVIVDKIVERLGRDLHTEKTSLEANKKKLNDDLLPLNTAIKDLDQLKDFETQLTMEEENLEEIKSKENQISIDITHAESTLQSLENDIERSQKMSKVGQFFRGLDPDRLLIKRAEAVTTIAGLKDTFKNIQSQLSQTKLNITKIREQVNHFRQKTSSYPPYGECLRNTKALTKTIEKIESKIRDIQKQLDVLRDKVLNNSKVVASTVYRTYLKGQIERKFDVVIIDEASMLALPMVYYVSGLSNKHVIIVGDFRQLPAIVHSKEEEVEKWIKRDIFRKAKIVDKLKNSDIPISLAILSTQYRMNQRICDVINSIFYKDYPLKTAPQVDVNIDDQFPFGDSDLYFCDTSDLNPWASLKIGSYSRFNILHALLMRNISWKLKESGYIALDDDTKASLGIISPYNAQTKLIEKLLSEIFQNHGVKYTGTVHRFQGNEKDTMIIDFTDSYGVRPSKFMKAKDINEEGARLLNVAISRARHHIILLANFEYMLKRVGRASIVGQILDMFKREGVALRPEYLLEIGPDDWIDAIDHLEPPNLEFDASTAGIFTEGSFYPAFSQDLKKSVSSIVIFSPYMTERGSSRWADLLRAKIESGIRVRLVTRPPGDQGGVLEEGLEELIGDLQKLGIVIDLRARIHEKFAIIDGEILWHGSLNIFSHRDTSESMLRIPSANACLQIGRFVTSPMSNKKGKDKKEIDIITKENPNCSNCSNATIWKNGRYGIYFECISCGEKVNIRSLRTKEWKGSRKRKSKTNKSSNGKICPECGSHLVRRKGRFGEFLGCTTYPRCRHTETI